MNRKLLFITFLAFLFMFAPIRVANAGIAKPLAGNPTVNSWFDHNNPGSAGNNLMIRYDGSTWTSNASVTNCTLGTNCYDGHDAIDFQASTNTDVLAAEAGSVTTFWNSYGGNMMRISHTSLGYSTFYGHLNSYIISSGTAYRSQHIAESGCTGSACSGAHLHFGAVDTLSSSGGNNMDPYGWTGSGSDPYGYNQGVLWGDSTCTPPSSGDWNIPTSDCTVNGYLDVTSNNIVIPNGAVLTVDGSSAHLDVNFASKSITILDGGKLLVTNNGKVE
jgi:Peptidase family M23